MENIRRVWLLRVVSWAALAAFLAWIFFNHKQRPTFDDFSVYYTAGLKALSHHTVFDVEGFFQFKYAPSVALLFGVTFSQIPIPLSAYLFYAVSFLGWLALAGFWIRNLAQDTRSREALWFAFLLIFGTPLRDELKLGQINLIPLALISLIAWRDSYRWSAWTEGIALSIAIQFKLYVLLLVPFYVWRKEFMQLLIMVLFTLVTNFGVLWSVHGWDFAIAENLAWAQSLTASSAALLYSRFNDSWIGVLGKHGIPDPLILGSWILLVLAFLAVLWHLRAQPSRKNIAFVLVSICILNPIVWPYWMLLTFPAVLWLVNIGVRQPPSWIWLAIAITGVVGLFQNQGVANHGGLLVACLMLAIAVIAVCNEAESTSEGLLPVSLSKRPSFGNSINAECLTGMSHMTNSQCLRDRNFSEASSWVCSKIRIPPTAFKSRHVRGWAKVQFGEYTP